MGRIVVTEFISLDGVIEDPGGSEDFGTEAGASSIDRGDEGEQVQARRDARLGGAAARAQDLRRLRRRLAVAGRASSPTSSTACPSTSSPRPSRAPSGTTRPCCAATSSRRSTRLTRGARRRHRRPRQRAARADSARARSRRRAAPDGLPRRARRGQAPLRRDRATRSGLRLASSRTVGDGVSILIFRPAGQDDVRAGAAT